MNKKMIIAIATGVTLGVVAGIFMSKKKYKNIADKEIESVKEVYKRDFTSNKVEETADLGESVPIDGVPLTVDEENFRITTSPYSVLLNEKSIDAPYIIPPSDFGEFEEYETISLIYCHDGILLDDNNDIVDDSDSIVGSDFANHFGEYEADSVYMRNDARKCDYEILKDYRAYSEIIGRMPYSEV